MDSRVGRGEIQVKKKKKKSISYLQVLDTGGTKMVREWGKHSGHSFYWGSMGKAGKTVWNWLVWRIDQTLGYTDSPSLPDT